jgi:hypothetical protein
VDRGLKISTLVAVQRCISGLRKTIQNGEMARQGRRHFFEGFLHHNLGLRERALMAVRLRAAPLRTRKHSQK